MSAIKIKVFIITFSLASMICFTRPKKQDYFYVDEHFIEKDYRKSKNLMYTKNFDEYKNSLYDIIKSINKDV
jgi:hypothetical protein